MLQQACILTRSTHRYEKGPMKSKTVKFVDEHMYSREVERK
jgi:hypothetical protein